MVSPKVSLNEIHTFSVELMTTELNKLGFQVTPAVRHVYYNKFHISAITLVLVTAKFTDKCDDCLCRMFLATFIFIMSAITLAWTFMTLHQYHDRTT
jgi:hypothetical protein